MSNALRRLIGPAMVLGLLWMGGPAAAQSLTVLSAASVQAAGTPPAAAPDPAQPEPPKPEPVGFLKGRFLVGAQMTRGLTVDDDLGSAFRVSPFFRTTPRRRGWGPSFGLSWISSDLYVSIDGRKTAVGTARLRPVMIGVGYSINRGRLVTNLSMVGGYAFNSARAGETLPEGYAASIEVRDAWVMRPQVGLTYALTHRVAVVGSVGYVLTNPQITIAVSDPSGAARTYRDTFSSHYFNVTVGAAFSIF